MTAAPASRPRLLVVAGPNGAGKTTITDLALGYFVRIFFVGTDRPEINAARVARRVLQGGHEVPIRKIVDRWGGSIANAASVAAEVDRFYVYDNSVDDRDAQLVLRAAEGRVVRASGDAPAWAGPILERLSPHES
jgi:predicted ABC-type ATPase